MIHWVWRGIARNTLSRAHQILIQRAQTLCGGISGREQTEIRYKHQWHLSGSGKKTYIYPEEYVTHRNLDFAKVKVLNFNKHVFILTKLYSLALMYSEISWCNFRHLNSSSEHALGKKQNKQKWNNITQISFQPQLKIFQVRLELRKSATNLIKRKQS